MRKNILVIPWEKGSSGHYVTIKVQISLWIMQSDQDLDWLQSQVTTG